jgi:hypothetical protein
MCVGFIYEKNPRPEKKREREKEEYILFSQLQFLEHRPLRRTLVRSVLYSATNTISILHSFKFSAK